MIMFTLHLRSPWQNIATVRNLTTHGHGTFTLHRSCVCAFGPLVASEVLRIGGGRNRITKIVYYYYYYFAYIIIISLWSLLLDVTKQVRRSETVRDETWITTWRPRTYEYRSWNLSFSRQSKVRLLLCSHTRQSGPV